MEHLPDNSATKTAMRDGDWSESEYIDAIQVNEIRMMRADLRAIFGDQQWSPPLVESPAQRAVAEQNKQQASAWNSHVSEQMRKAQLALEGR